MRKIKVKPGLKSALLKTALVVVVLNVVYILIQQEITLNNYRIQERYYKAKIEEEKAKAEKLERLKVLYNTDMYIEKIAREKLGLVKSGEKMFIDISQ